LALKSNGVKRYRPPIPPQATREMKVHCERKTTMPKMRDGGGIGGQVFCVRASSVDVFAPVNYQLLQSRQCLPAVNRLLSNVLEQYL
jgi:hypothetical protein